MARPRPLCGTVQGYRRHIREKEPTCDICKKAWNLYQAEKRALNPDTPKRDNYHQSVRQRALRLLGLRHERELEWLILKVYDEDRAKGRKP